MTPMFAHRPKSEIATKSYKTFRPFIREDFRECCAYCLLHELLASGQENFELDHFKPKSQFKELEHDYDNIYYSCHVCNNTKRDSWPGEELLTKGYQFVDYCRDDFSAHFADNNGRWEPTSLAGEYTEAKLRLNRDHLVKIRNLVAGLLAMLGMPPIDWDRPIKDQVSIISEHSGYHSRNPG